MKFGERPELWTWVIIFAIDEIRELRGGAFQIDEWRKGSTYAR
jgi:hypothetical protein